MFFEYPFGFLPLYWPGDEEDEDENVWARPLYVGPSLRPLRASALGVFLAFWDFFAFDARRALLPRYAAVSRALLPPRVDFEAAPRLPRLPSLCSTPFCIDTSTLRLFTRGLRVLADRDALFF